MKTREIERLSVEIEDLKDILNKVKSEKEPEIAINQRKAEQYEKFEKELTSRLSQIESNGQNGD